jgi:hypothetical protein
MFFAYWLEDTSFNSRLFRFRRYNR